MFLTTCLAIFTGKCIKEACETTLQAEYHGNIKLETEDAAKVSMGEMSKREFNRNIKNGKYYASAKPQDKLDSKVLETYYKLRSLGTLNLECDLGKYNFIKDLTQEEARARYFELLRK